MISSIKGGHASNHNAVLSITSPLRQEINKISEETINWDSNYRFFYSLKIGKPVVHQQNCGRCLIVYTVFRRAGIIQAFICCTIPREEFGLLIEYDVAPMEERNRLLESDGYNIAGILYRIILYECSDIVLKYTLVLIYQILEVDLTNVKIFYGYGKKSKTNMWRPYCTLLDSEDSFIKNISGVIITQLASWGKILMDVKSMKIFLSWLLRLITEKKNRYLQDNIRCLQTLMKREEFHSVFDTLDGVSFIVELLRLQNNFQIQYQLLFCLWLLTFNKEIASQEVMTKTAIKLLTDGLKDSARVKIVRITLAVYRNLVTKPEDPDIIKQNCNMMIGYRLLKQLHVLAKQNLTDEELENDLSFLIGFLENSLEEFSSFDLYVSELKSGDLRWSPPHKSSEFWTENVTRLNKNNYDLLHVLIELLKENNNSEVLSIACFDIGQYVKYYPLGKKVIEDLGAKNIIMDLLQHSDPIVRYESLITVQRIMMHDDGWFQK